MWKTHRRTTLIFPPVRRLRNQLHRNANEIALLTRELNEAKQQRHDAIEHARRKQSQTHDGSSGNVDELTRERNEARLQNEQLVERVRQLEAKCESLERDYLVSVDAHAALLRLNSSTTRNGTELL